MEPSMEVEPLMAVGESRSRPTGVEEQLAALNQESSSLRSNYAAMGKSVEKITHAAAGYCRQPKNSPQSIATA